MRIETRRVRGVADPAGVVALVSADAEDVLWLDSMRTLSGARTPSVVPTSPIVPTSTLVPASLEPWTVEDRHPGAGAAGSGMTAASPEAAADPRERARWSIVGAAGGPFGATYVHEGGLPVLCAEPASEPWFAPVVDDLALRAAVPSGAVDTGNEFFTVLERVLAATPIVAESPVPGCGFALGWIGYLGYELGRESGGPVRFADGHPDGALRFVDRAVVVDAQEEVTWVLALVDDDLDAAVPAGIASTGNRAWMHSTARALERLVEDEHDPGRPAGTDARPNDAAQVVPVPGDPPRDATDVGAVPTGLQAGGRVSRARYERDVDACREEIRDGNAFQVCLTTSFSVGAPRRPVSRPGDDVAVMHCSRPDPLREDPDFAEYLRLRAADPVPFGSFLRLGRVTVASRSPERFVAVSSSGRVVAEPIKGTRPRGRTREEDDSLRRALDTSTKDRAENVMIVDLLRNDLLRTAIPGSVHVERLCDIESYASVHQMVSTVVGTVRPGVSPAEVVRAAFPPGSMTGAPKISAMAIADRLEDAPRGVYSGAIGYFAMNGAVDLAVAIRTLVSVRHVAADPGDGDVGRPVATTRSLGAGGAVTWSSTAQDEADEVETKTRSVLGALGAVVRW